MPRQILALVPVVVIGLSAPAVAQALSEQEARKIAQSLDEAQISAEQHHDVTAAGALFAEDAVEVTPSGLASGRAEIEKFLAAGLKDYAPDMGKIDRVIPISDGVILGAGSWGGTYHGPDGPVHLHGYWAQTLVRDGNTWKIRQEAYNSVPPPPEAK
jgi:ketosteroid isomerase-like protein